MSGQAYASDPTVYAWDVLNEPRCVCVVCKRVDGCTGQPRTPPSTHGLGRAQRAEARCRQLRAGCTFVEGPARALTQLRAPPLQKTSLAQQPATCLRPTTAPAQVPRLRRRRARRPPVMAVRDGGARAGAQRRSRPGARRHRRLLHAAGVGCVRGRWACVLVVCCRQGGYQGLAIHGHSGACASATQPPACPCSQSHPGGCVAAVLATQASTTTFAMHRAAPAVCNALHRRRPGTLASPRTLAMVPAWRGQGAQKLPETPPGRSRLRAAPRPRSKNTVHAADALRVTSRHQQPQAPKPQALLATPSPQPTT